MIEKALLTRFFKIKSGDYHATSELDEGTVPLISCGDSENGLVAYFEVEASTQYQDNITVAYNGLPLTSKFHPYRFGAKDDVAVLVPKTKLQELTLIFFASMLNLQRWRYSYGRKCFRKKLERLSVYVPLTADGDLDENFIEGLTSRNVDTFIPQTTPVPAAPIRITAWKDMPLSEVFNVDVGTIHKTESLDIGRIPLVSCSEMENGIEGYYDISTEELFENALTMSFDGKPLTIKYHTYKFATYDNVGVLMPKIPLRKTTLIFIAALLSLEQWRYSYGRKCYQAKAKNVRIKIPVKIDGEIDEDAMESIVKALPYSDFVLN
jgi:hypothetical protein